MWPPVREHTSMRRVRSSSETARSSSRVIGLRSAGEWIRSRMAIGDVFSGRTGYHEISNLCQLLREQRPPGEALQTVVDQRLRSPPRPVDAQQRRIGALAQSNIAAGGFAERGGRRGDV